MRDSRLPKNSKLLQASIFSDLSELKHRYSCLKDMWFMIDTITQLAFTYSKLLMQIQKQCVRICSKLRIKTLEQRH